MISIDEKQLASKIENTMLKPMAGKDRISELCEQAVRYGFASVVVNSRWTDFVADKLHDSSVKTCTVISFPLGADSTRIKIAQANQAIKDGAQEIDMVADLSAIVKTDSRYLTSQLKAVARICHSVRPKVILKVIIEAAALEMDQKIFACHIARQAGADFIKTSTGFHPAGGATLDDVRLIRDTAVDCRIKAAGGIKTVQQAIAMIQAGADRIGTSSAAEIMKQIA